MTGTWPETPVDVQKLELLTAVEEVELAQAIEAGLLAQERLGAGGVRDPLLLADLRRLARAGEDACDRMILANLRLVHFWARRRVVAGADGGLSLQDLVSEGTLGLIRAVQKFDFTLGFKFSTYSSWWIRQHMQRAVARNTAATVDFRTLEELARLSASQESLTAALRRTPTEDELAADMDTTTRRVRQLLSMSRHAVSLDRPLDDGRDAAVLGDLLAGDADIAGEAIAADMHLQVRRLLRCLTDRERRVVTLRFGLAGGEPLDVDTTARALGVTPDMVRTCLNGALQRLRGTDGISELHAFLEAA